MTTTFTFTTSATWEDKAWEVLDKWDAVCARINELESLSDEEFNKSIAEYDELCDKANELSKMHNEYTYMQREAEILEEALRAFKANTGEE